MDPNSNQPQSPIGSQAGYGSSIPQQNISVNVPANPVNPYAQVQTPPPMHTGFPSEKPHASAGEAFARKGTEVVVFIFSSLEVMLTIRFVFKLFAAQSVNLFVSLIYQITQLFVEPFLGIFRSAPSAMGHVLEIETIIAGIIYALVAVGLIKIVRLFK
jgi:hypothetical protein